MKRLKNKWFWITLAIFLIDEATPFIPLFGIMIVVGLFYTPVLRWMGQTMLNYVGSVKDGVEEEKR